MKIGRKLNIADGVIFAGAFINLVVIALIVIFYVF